MRKLYWGDISGPEVTSVQQVVTYQMMLYSSIRGSMLNPIE